MSRYTKREVLRMEKKAAYWRRRAMREWELVVVAADGAGKRACKLRIGGSK